MSGVRLDGAAVAKKVRAEVAERAKTLLEGGVTPGLAVVLVGDDPASAVYVRNKTRAAAEAGVRAVDTHLPASATQAELMSLVAKLNADPEIDGILVQLPLPSHLNAEAITDTIVPGKDVDGFHPHNIGLLSQGRPQFVAATPKGCMRLLAEAGIEISGKHAVVIGRSNIVGKPMAMLLTNASATVTVCHSRTPNLAEEVGRADIVVAAIGRARMIPGAWIKPGAVVLDVGINRGEDGKLCGDVDYASVLEVASAVTPVPGGVGPMTIACLLENTVTAAERRAS